MKPRKSTIHLARPLTRACVEARERFSAYLDGDMTGVVMQTTAQHLDSCADCAAEWTAWTRMQDTLSTMGQARPPADLQERLRGAVADEFRHGTHLSLTARLSRFWHATLGPIALRAAAGTAAALVLIGGIGMLSVFTDTPAAVQANDQPIGAMTSPRFLYSEVPAQPLDVGREVPVLVEAKIDDQGRVYDYSILSGPTDNKVERRLQENLLTSVFQPATVFGQPVPSHIILTYTGVSVHG